MSRPDVQTLFERWRCLLRAGQFVPAEELCENHPELVPEVEALIRRYTVETIGTHDEARPVVDEHAKTSVRGVLSTENNAPAPTQVWGTNDLPTEDELVFSVGTFGDFKLLAQGGLGEVFLAGDKDLHRDVVLKFMRKHVEEDPASVTQFALEAEVAARLDHPGIVPVYGMGHTSDGRPFQVMRFIRGTSLEEKIDRLHAESGERNLEFRQLLQRFSSICQTIAYAHSRGIVHRDLKPENVMLGKYGETLVVDWGLAMSVERSERDRHSGERTLMPLSGENGSGSGPGIAGTPSYMSPEQAEGAEDVGPPSDVYSLGSLLYKLLTGVPPFQGSSATSILRKVRDGIFPRPRTVDASVPAPLEAICLKAMQRSPEDRYASAQRMAADVEAFLADEPVGVYEEPWTARLLRWTRHRPRLTQSIVALLLVTIVGLSVWGTQSVVHARNEVEREAEFLSTQASFQEELFRAGIDELRDDVLLLARRPRLRDVAETARIATTTSADRRPVADVFEDFLGLNPDYVQVRFLDAAGQEIVRVDRTERGGPTAVVADEELQNKKDRPYFRRTAELLDGEVHLSPIDVNEEQGRHQWDVPVIRAATPLTDDDGTFLGIVIINLHFGHLAEMLASESSGLSVLLADDEGRFLVHSDADPLEFAFERALDVPVEAVYPDLANFRQLNANEFEKLDAVPRTAVLVVDETAPTSSAPEPSTTNAPAERPSPLYEMAGRIVADPRFQGLTLKRTKYDAADRGREGARPMVVFLGVTGSQREKLLQRVRAENASLPDADFRTHVLPATDRGDRLAIHARKIRFDPQRPDRYVQLVLTHAH